MKKSIRIIIFTIIIVSVLIFEGISLYRNEISHELSLESEISDEIELNLNLIKVGIQSRDTELFSENLEKAKISLEKYQNLFLLKEKHSEYYEGISEYLEFLDGKRELFSEISSLNASISALTDHLKENFGEKSTISRDNVRSASEKISAEKLKIEEYNAEIPKNIIETTNSLLDNVSEKVNSLAECIDVCYKNSIVEIADSLNSLLEDYSSKIPELNANIEKEFNFETIDNLKSARPKGY